MDEDISSTEAAAGVTTMGAGSRLAINASLQVTGARPSSSQRERGTARDHEWRGNPPIRAGRVTRLDPLWIHLTRTDPSFLGEAKKAYPEAYG